MLNIQDLLRQKKELKDQGNALWDKTKVETASMDPQTKDAYMAEVRKTTAQIMADIAACDEQLQAAAAFAADEREQIKEQAKREPTNDPQRSRTEFTCMGQLMQAMACQASGVIAGMFSDAYRQELGQKLAFYRAAASGMNTAVPSEGGYLLRKDWTGSFLDKARESSQILPLCRPQPIGQEFDGLEYPYVDETSRVDGSRWGGVQVFWRAEAASVTAKKPKMGRGELRLEDIMGLAYATERLLRDAVALEGVLTDSFLSEFAFTIDNSILRGNGAGQMLGFLNSPALISVTRDADDLITITSMLSRIPSRLKPGAVWLHHADWLPKLIRLKIGDTPVFIPPGGLPNAPGGMLLGKPLIELEQCSAVGTAGDLILCNLGEYVVIEKSNEGVRYDTSMHVKFETDEMAFRWVKRINGQPIVRTAITPAQGSSTQSPFVTVAA